MLICGIRYRAQEQQAIYGGRRGWSSPFVWLETPDGVIDAKGGNDRFCEWAAVEFKDDPVIAAYAAAPASATKDLFGAW